MSAFVVSDTERGTGEAVWLPRLATLPAFEVSRLERVVVLAPHPDDEVLGVGGWLAGLRCAIDVVAITDGEASHPGRGRELVEIRAGERALALARLGIAARVTRLGCGDGRVAACAELPALLAPLVFGASLVVAPWDRDGHPDHDATGAAAALACRAAGVRLVSYPIWAWHWATPPELPWTRARRIELSPRVREAKAHAIAAYRSQLDDILPASVLARFHRGCEVVFA